MNTTRQTPLTYSKSQAALLFSGKPAKRKASENQSVKPQPAAPQSATPAPEGLVEASADQLIISAHLSSPAGLDAPPKVEATSGVPATSSTDGDESDVEPLTYPSTAEYVRYQAEQRKKQHEKWGERFAPLGRLMDYCIEGAKTQTRRVTGTAANAVYGLRDATTQAASNARKKAQKALANALKSASEAIDPGDDRSVRSEQSSVNS